MTRISLTHLKGSFICGIGRLYYTVPAFYKLGKYTEVISLQQKLLNFNIKNYHSIQCKL